MNAKDVWAEGLDVVFPLHVVRKVIDGSADFSSPHCRVAQEDKALVLYIFKRTPPNLGDEDLLAMLSDSQTAVDLLKARHSGGSIFRKKEEAAGFAGILRVVGWLLTLYKDRRFHRLTTAADLQRQLVRRLPSGGGAQQQQQQQASDKAAQQQKKSHSSTPTTPFPDRLAHLWVKHLCESSDLAQSNIFSGKGGTIQRQLILDY